MNTENTQTPPQEPVKEPKAVSLASSFKDFLEKCARVPAGTGTYTEYTFKGREALEQIVELIDDILKQGLADSEVALAGGAQFGKTILELNLAAYLTANQFRNFGLYLPDDDLVQGVVDSKFRPDVVDQLNGFAEMVQLGKSVNKSGKTVNRKGAFMVTNRDQKAIGMIRGLGKVPTTFSMDVAALDEVDDIEPRMMKFVRGRLTASDLRLVIKIGTQRVHARGMNKAWKDGSQGVVHLKCSACQVDYNPEEEFPQIVRLGTFNTQHSTPNADGMTPDRDAAMLTWSGDFKPPGSESTVAIHKPENDYHLACVKCGGKLDRFKPMWHHRAPSRCEQRQWSFRISQLSIGAIDLSQIVNRFQAAVADPEEMVAFRCDVLGLPHSTAQRLTPGILDRARDVEPYDLRSSVSKDRIAFGGLDMGDRCWLFAREVEKTKPPKDQNTSPQPSVGEKSDQTVSEPPQRAPAITRLLAAERMTAGDVVARTVSLFAKLGLTALFIDERPLVNEARSLALILNGLQDLDVWPDVPTADKPHAKFPTGLIWDGTKQCWTNLKCAVVRFTKARLGTGISQGLVIFEEGGHTKFVPCIECNRYETIDQVVREFLTPAEGVFEIVNRRSRENPTLLLPRLTPGHSPNLDTLDAHLIAGSEREKAEDGSLGEYVHQCENHFLLADGYSKLAEIVCTGGKVTGFNFESVKNKSPRRKTL